jgi:hypothetical protein
VQKPERLTTQIGEPPELPRALALVKGDLTVPDTYILIMYKIPANLHP